MKSETPDDDYPSITPYLITRDAAGALAFYKTAFDAEEIIKMVDAGRIIHAEISVRGHPVMLADEFPKNGIYAPDLDRASPVILVLRVADADATVERAVAAGARIIRPVADQPHGDRSGKIADPFGHIWIVAHRIG